MPGLSLLAVAQFTQLTAALGSTLARTTMEPFIVPDSTHRSLRLALAYGPIIPCDWPLRTNHSLRLAPENLPRPLFFHHSTYIRGQVTVRCIGA